MKRLILSSTGFTNEHISEIFLRWVKKSPKDVKALWIPTAAIEDDAKEMLGPCMDDLLDLGILRENIRDYDLNVFLNEEEIKEYDVIYVCGGTTPYLIQKMREINFDKILECFFKYNGIYIGVSAGSVALSTMYENSISYVKVPLDVHVSKGNPDGKVDLERVSEINLTDNQALLICDESYEIVS